MCFAFCIIAETLLPFARERNPNMKLAVEYKTILYYTIETLEHECEREREMCVSGGDEGRESERVS